MEARKAARGRQAVCTGTRKTITTQLPSSKRILRAPAGQRHPQYTIPGTVILCACIYEGHFQSKPPRPLDKGHDIYPNTT